MEAEEAREGAYMALTIYWQPLTAVSSFKYLGRILPALDYDWPVVVSNLRKLRNKWAHLSRLLGQEGADAKMSGNFYREVVQAVLLFGRRRGWCYHMTEYKDSLWNKSSVWLDYI